MNWKSLLKYICKWLGRVGILGCALLILGYGLLQTQGAKKIMADLLSRHMSTPSNSRVDIMGIEGNIPFNLLISRIALSDVEGQWLAIRDLRISWSPLSILSGHLRCKGISADSLVLERMPKAPQETPTENRRGLSPSWKVLSRVIIEDIHTKEVTLGASLLGKPTSFTLAGKLLALEKETGLVTSVHIQRIDQSLPRATLQITAKKNQDTFELYSEIEDSRDGILSSALGLSGKGPLSLRLDGKGPLNDWKGKLDAKAGDYHVDMGIGIKQDQFALRAALDGTLETQGHITGVLNMHADLRRDGATGTVSGNFNGESNRLQGLPPFAHTLLGSNVRLAGKFELANRRRLKLNEIRMDGVAANLSGRTDIDFSKNHIRGHYRISLPRLARLSSAVGKKLSGSLELDGEISGALANMALTAKANVHNIEVEGVTLDQLTFNLRTQGSPHQSRGHFELEAAKDIFKVALKTDFSVNGPILSLSNTGLSGPGILGTGDLVMNIGTGLAEGSLKADVQDISILGPFTTEPLNGSIELTSQLRAVNGMQDLALNLKGNDLALNAGKIKGVSIQLALNDVFKRPGGKTTISVRRFTANDLTVDALLLTAKGDNSRVDFHARAQGRFAKAFHMETAGTYTASSEGATWRFQEFKGKTNAHTLSLLRPTQIKHTSEGYALEPLVLTLGSGKIEASGALGSNRIDLEGRFDHIVLDEFPRLDVPASGLVSGYVRITGSTASPEVESHLDIKDLRFHNPAMKDMQSASVISTAHFQDNRLEAAVRLQGLPGHDLQAKASIPLKFSLSPFDYSLPAEGTVNSTVQAMARLSSLSAILGQELGDISGTLTSALHVHGTLRAPQIEADLKLEEIQLRDPSLHDIQPESIIAKARIHHSRMDAVVEVKGNLQNQAQGRLDIPVDLSLSPFAFTPLSQGSIQGGFEGSINLSTLKALFRMDMANISGQLKADFSLGGMAGSPELSGEAHIEKGAYENFFTGTVLRQINAKALLQNRRVNLESVHATDGEDGVFSGKGGINLDADKNYPLAMDLSFKNARLLRHDDVNATAEGLLMLSGSLKGMTLEGQVVLAPMDIYLMDRTESEIPQVDITEIGTQAEPIGEIKDHPSPNAQAPTRNISLDIDATLPNRVFVRGRGLDAEYKGHLDIKGQAASPIITGSLSVVRGDVYFLDRRFKVTEGSLDFHGNQPPSPLLNIRSEYKTDTLKAILNLTGDISAPEIALESDPHLPEDEILSRLLFGRGLDNITPWQAFRLSQALASLSGGQGLNILGSVRQAIHVDKLEVVQGDEDQVAIGVGKYVSDEVFIDVQKEVAGEGGKVSVEVQVAPNISVESEVGSDSTADIGINWGFNY